MKRAASRYSMRALDSRSDMPMNSCGWSSEQDLRAFRFTGGQRNVENSNALLIEPTNSGKKHEHPFSDISPHAARFALASKGLRYACSDLLSAMSCHTVQKIYVSAMSCHLSINN